MNNPVRIGDATLYHGDCLGVMREMDAASVDTVITDPPYGLKFMGKDWDHGVPGEAFWREALRVAKPGAVLMAFGGTRTVHRLVCAIEDAGWEIRDTIMWLYGSGFPKSHDISKAIDAAAAQLWHGWGSALKPAHEPICVAMKPLDGTYAESAQKWGVAGFWIDGGRVGTSKDVPYAVKNGKPITAKNWLRKHEHGSGYDPRTMDMSGMRADIGRWPANVIHDGSDEVLAGFPETKSGDLDQASVKAADKIYGGGFGNGKTNPRKFAANSGSAARFFYCAKASPSERTMGGRVENRHPTVKPLALMQYLCRLTKTPTGGVVLDPFMGSGSTGIAALREGRPFIGIEQDAESFETARARIETDAPTPAQMELVAHE